MQTKFFSRLLSTLYLGVILTGAIISPAVMAQGFHRNSGPVGQDFH